MNENEINEWLLAWAKEVQSLNPENAGGPAVLKSFLELNCFGFTNILTKVFLFFLFAFFINISCPLCRPPIVGIKEKEFILFICS